MIANAALPQARYQPGEVIAERYEVRQVHFGGVGRVALP